MESELLSCKIKVLINYDLIPTQFPSIISAFAFLLILYTLILDKLSGSTLSCCHALSHTCIYKPYLSSKPKHNEDTY